MTVNDNPAKLFGKKHGKLSLFEERIVGQINHNVELTWCESHEHNRSQQEEI